jgi:hypothetical protein
MLVRRHKMASKNKFIGKWRITSMSEWDKEYCDMEVQAYLNIEKNLMGDFQFGLVSGQIDGRIVKRPDGDCFDFTWDGNDECDPASGNGWMKLKDKNNAEGEIKLHLRDDSTFQAKRMKK